MALVDVTDEAASRLHELLEREDKGGFGLRMKVVGGGCSGLRYELSFDDQLSDVDNKIDAAHGVHVIVDEKSALYLVGSTLDFVDTLQESGFKIENPNASNSCGCGESFAA